MRFLGWLRPKATKKQQEAAAPIRWAWLGGRRIYRDQFYFLPKDEQEGHRLDFQHYLYCMALGGLYRAPVRSPRAVLDVACGTGIWGRDIAKKFKHAEVTGFDKDRTPLDASLKRLGAMGAFPQNFHFFEANALERFPFDSEKFDFTHARLISGFVPKTQWVDVLAEMARVTRRGGYVEIVDFEPATCESQALTYLWGLIQRLTEQNGRHFGAGPYLEQYFKQAGFQRVQVRRVEAGKGRYAEREQRYMRSDFLEGFRNARPLLIRAGLATEQEYDQALAQANADPPHLRSYLPIYSVFSLKL